MCERVCSRGVDHPCGYIQCEYAFCTCAERDCVLCVTPCEFPRLFFRPLLPCWPHSMTTHIDRIYNSSYVYCILCFHLRKTYSSSRTFIHEPHRSVIIRYAPSFSNMCVRFVCRMQILSWLILLLCKCGCHEENGNAAMKNSMRICPAVVDGPYIPQWNVHVFPTLCHSFTVTHSFRLNYPKTNKPSLSPSAFSLRLHMPRLFCAGSPFAPCPTAFWDFVVKLLHIL